MFNFFETLEESDTRDGELIYLGLDDEPRKELNELLEKIFAEWFKKI